MKQDKAQQQRVAEFKRWQQSATEEKLVLASAVDMERWRTTRMHPQRAGKFVQVTLRPGKSKMLALCVPDIDSDTVWSVTVSGGENGVIFKRTFPGESGAQAREFFALIQDQTQIKTLKSLGFREI